VNDRHLKIHWRSREHITVYHGKTRTLASGQALIYLLGFSQSCVAITAGSSITYKSATVSVGGAAVTTRGKGVPVSVKCTDATLEADTWTGRKEPSSRGPYAQLSAAIQLPSDMKAGTVVNYTLALTNHASTVFTFTTCPSYTEGVGVGSHITSRDTTARYSLNCNGISIPPGGTTTFAMKIRLPDVPSAYVAKFTWMMDHGPSCNAGVRLS
jgi:hypothetical protein